ncbi:MAG: phage baseplate assembly protein V [Sodalis sp. (in: enterobacteria)]|uniref:phage baseplate assembly protein V n=1 Tax=Sodalis sp. (in: enterobacteria) TaxID=1898979 RepID=UPI0039E46854
MKTALADIKRLLANLIRAGVVSRVDTTTGRCRVSIGQMETDWLPWLTPRASRVRVWSAPSPGEQVTVLSPGGDLSGGFVLPAVFSDIHPAPATAPDAVHLTFPDGAVMEYDPDTGALTARGIKTAQIQASESVVVTTPVVLVTASERITLDTPEVVCTQHLRARTLSITEGGTMRGTITHSGDSLTSNGVTLDSHRHSGVKGGDDLSGGPSA